MAKASVSVSASGASYTGKEIRPRVAVSYGGTTLAEGSDYELSYANNLDAGHAVVTVTGTGSYAGRNLATFDIAPLDLSKAKVRTVKKGLAYTGKAQRPALKVTVGSVTLRAGIDYSVSYPKAVNAGSYTLKVTGGENAPGTARARFTIGKAKQKVTVGKAVRTFRARDLKRHAAAFSLGAKAKTRLSYTVPAKARKAGVTVSSKGRVSLAKGTAKGTYTVVARAKGSANYQPATKKIAVRVK